MQTAEVQNNDMFERIAALIGRQNLEKINSANVTVVGLGGVGYTAAEILVRSGVMHLTLADFDTVSQSNINRQLLATHSTVGKPKTEAALARLSDINPDAKIITINEMMTADSAGIILNGRVDYCIDAIDTIAHKVSLIRFCLEHNIRLISSLGAGNRLDPTQVTVCDISQTAGDPLARNIRHKLRIDGKLPKVTVVCSREPPRRISQPECIQNTGTAEHPKSLVGSFAGVTVAFGNLIASRVIMDLMK